MKNQSYLKPEKDVRYSIDSWKGYFYIHTNEEARDYKILKCKTDDIGSLEKFIEPKELTVIGGLEFLDDFIIRSEKCNAIQKYLSEILNLMKRKR